MAEQVYQVALNAAEDNPALALSAADADNAITMTSSPGDAVSAEAAEAWAVGTRNGVPVQSGDATYENSSKYWAGQSESYADDAEAWAKGTRDGVPVGSSDETFENSSKYWATVALDGVSGLAGKADKNNPAFTGNGTISGKFTLGKQPTANMDAATKQYVDTAVTNKTEIDDTAGDGDTDVTWSADKLVDECFAVTTGAITSLPMTITDARITAECVVLDEMIDQQVDIGWVTTAGKLILYGTLPTGTTIASKKIKVKRCHGLTEDAVTLSIRFQTSTSANGNYLVVDAGNLLPGTQYSWYLYKVVSGTETQVSGIGSTTSYPTASRWYQEATYNLEDGVTYKAKIWPTAQSSNVTTSGTVTFTAALTS